MKRLLRDKRHGVIGGVAAGFGRYLDVDPVLVRLAFVLLAFVNGLGLLAYLAAWVLIPQGDSADTGSVRPATDAGVQPADGQAAGSQVGAGVEALRDAGARLASEVASEVRQATAGAENAQAGLGALLVFVGSLMLAHNLGWLSWPRWASVETLWPLVLVALGAGLLAKSRRPAPGVRS